MGHDKVVAKEREYFRVDGVFPIIWRKVDKEDFPYDKARIISEHNNQAFDEEFSDYEKMVGPKLWKMLVKINSKLDLIMDKLGLRTDAHKKAESKRVNVSASGLRFTVTYAVEIGDILEIEMILPTRPPITVSTYGSVVRIKETGDGEHEIALQFIDMDEDVRSGIFRYVFDREREIIREQKENVEND